MLVKSSIQFICSFDLISNSGYVEIHTGPSKRYNIILDGSTAGILITLPQNEWPNTQAYLHSFFRPFLSDMKTAVIILGALVATVLGKNNFISYITFQREAEREREREIIYYNFSHCTRTWYISYQRAAKAKASLRICANSPAPSLLAHTKCG